METHDKSNLDFWQTCAPSEVTPANELVAGLSVVGAVAAHITIHQPAPYLWSTAGQGQLAWGEAGAAVHRSLGGPS